MATSRQRNAGQSEEQTKEAIFIKLLIAFILVGGIAFVVVDSFTKQHVKDAVEGLLEWVEDNPLEGFFVFTLVYFGATVLFIPGSILTLGGGFIFAKTLGLWLGVLVATVGVVLGACSGAIVAFLLARYLLRGLVSNLAKKFPVFLAVDLALKNKGFRIMALLRLSPIIPFNVLNYLSGLTAITLWAYTWALLFLLPGTVIFVFFGASAGSLTESEEKMNGNKTVQIVTIVVGSIFGLLAIIATSYYAKKELNRAIDDPETPGGAAATSDESARFTINYDNVM